MNPRSTVAVIGAGPGGIAAAVQLKRFGLQPVVFEKHEVGGLLRNANWVENYPGFPDGISGPDLVERLNRHLSNVRIPLLNEEVLQLDFNQMEDLFEVVTAEHRYRAGVVVAASGTRPRVLTQALELPPDVREKVLYEVYPIRGCAGKHIIIVGAGDAALDYALNLARVPSNRVTVIYRGAEIKALPLLRSRCLQTDTIEMLERHEVETIDAVERGGLALAVRTPAGVTRMQCDYLLAAVGREAETGYFSRRLLDMEAGLVDGERLFLVGDVGNGLFRQASIAAGNGIEAAMRVCRGIKE